MYARVSLDALEAERRLEDCPRICRGFDNIAELLRLFVALVVGVVHLGQGHVPALRHRRYGLRQHLSHAVGKTHDPRGILQRLFRLDDVECRDLRNAVRTVFLCHISFDIVAPPSGKVDIEVGHRLTFRVQKSLKEQAVLEWVEIGDSHRVGRQ